MKRKNGVSKKSAAAETRNAPVKKNSVSPAPRPRGHDKRPRSESKKSKAVSTQSSIPYKAMYRDGVCHTKDGRFSKTVRFYDINYQLAQAEDWALGQEAFQGDRTFPRTLDLFWTPYSLYLC